MKKYFRIIITIFAVFALMQMSCKILSFEGNPLVVNIAIEEDFHVIGGNLSYNLNETVNLASLLEDNDISTDDIEEVVINNIQVIVSENNTVAGSQLTLLRIFFTPAGGILASLSSPVDINTILNNPIDPYSTAATLGIDPAGVALLTDALNMSPPPTITLMLRVDVSAAPVDFKAKVIVAFQVKYTP